MQLFIKKHPSLTTLIAKSYAAVCPIGYEPSTETEADNWVAQQLAAGWTPALDTPIAEVPSSVRTAQLRQWLVARNVTEDVTLLDAVEEKLKDLAAWPSQLEMRKAQIRWEFEPNVNRADPLVQALGRDLGMDDVALDAAFIEISQIS